MKLLKTGQLEEIRMGFQNVILVIIRTVAWMMGGKKHLGGSTALRSFVELKLNNIFYRSENESKNLKELKEYEA